MRLRFAICAALVPALLAAAPARVPETPVFAIAIGAGAPLAGEEQSAFLPCGDGPASFDVDADGRWWILDAIGARVVVVNRDGTIARTLALPSASGKNKKPDFYGDLALDGSGGVFVLDATARKVVRLGADGTVTNSFGAEKIPKKAPRLDLPRRLSVSAGALFIEDEGSDALLRFAPDGAYRDAAAAPNAVPLSAGGLFAISQSGGATWLEAAPSGGHRRPVVKLKAAEGRDLGDAWLVGATAAGEAVVAQSEPVPGSDAGARLRILRFDAKGKILADREMPAPSDGVTPTRRMRLTPGGGLAYFKIEAGRFSAFESAW